MFRPSQIINYFNKSCFLTLSLRCRCKELHQGAWRAYLRKPGTVLKFQEMTSGGFGNLFKEPPHQCVVGNSSSLGVTSRVWQQKELGKSLASWSVGFRKFPLFNYHQFGKECHFKTKHSKNNQVESNISQKTFGNRRTPTLRVCDFLSDDVPA